MSAGKCCERCPGATAAEVSHIARRRILKAAVFQPTAAAGHGPGTQAPATAWGSPGLSDSEPLTPRESAPGSLTAGRSALTPDMTLGQAPSPSRRIPGVYRAVSGQIVDVSPHVVTIGDAAGERRFILTSDAKAWRGATLEPAALRPGDQAIIRLLPSRPGVADRIWANIGRVTGTIIGRSSDGLIVAEGATMRQQTVVIPPQASSRIEVRYPNLRPGYLIDVIGLRRQGVLEGLVPATPQPTYRADALLPPRSHSGRLSDAITGSAVWHDSTDEPYGVLGVLYPAIDPASGCAEDRAAGISPGQAPVARDLPYLAIGSALDVRNECTGISWTLPVTGCAPIARLFNDRCVTCVPSPRGRIADLTIASFIALGGELESGCFSATLAIGR